MRLVFGQEHNSVKAFEPIEIPKFTVITGRNGSGKSHLLEAIQLGKVNIEGIRTNQIQKFDYRDFDYNYQRKTDRSFKQNAWGAIQPETGSVSMRLVALDGQIENKRLIEKKAKELKKPFIELELKDFLGEGLEEGEAQSIIDSIERYKEAVDSFIFEDANSSDEVAQSIYDSLIKTSSKLVSGYKEAEFTTTLKKTAISGRKLLMDLSDTFFEYHQALSRNELKKGTALYQESGDFKKTHGEAPWDIVQEIFDGMRINFSVNNPIEEDIDPFSGNFQIKFKNNDREGKEIPFNALSSGEKILLTLANSIFTARKRNAVPKLILLDEIDGPLNPAVLSGFVEYLQSNFIENGINVIIATHSPSTIAFSPTESIYRVNTTLETPITHIDKKEGIASLSDGYITIQDVLEFSAAPTGTLILSEGKNYRLLSKAKDLFAPGTDLSILSVRELGSGQLRVLYEFLRKFNLTKNFIFVWDNDYRFKEDGSLRDLSSLKATASISARAYIFDTNTDGLVTRGIENLFDSNQVSDYEGSLKSTNSGVSNKYHFEKYVLAKAGPEELFKNFKPLFTFIADTKTLTNI